MMTINCLLKRPWSNTQNLVLPTLAKKKIIIQLIFLTFLSCGVNNNFKLESIKTENGWGYVIKKNDKIIIKQSIIPVVSNNRSFESEKDALKVGACALQKLKENKIPSITEKDLILLAIKV